MNELTLDFTPSQPLYAVLQKGAQIVSVASLAIGGSPTGGTYPVSITSGGVTQTASGIAYNASAAALQTALQALSNVGAGNVLVTGSATLYTIIFAGTLGPLTMSASAAGLTGGTPTATPVSGGAMISLTAGNRPAAAIPLSDAAAPGHYLGSVPANMPAGDYSVLIYQQTGASPADTADGLPIGVGDLSWDGMHEASDQTMAATIASLATVDGISISQWIKALISFMGGTTNYTDNLDGTFTMTFLSQASVALVTVTANKITGQRTAVVWH